VGIGKLSRRLFLLTLAALIPAAIVQFYNLHAIRSAKESEVHEQALRAGQLAALEMQRIVSGAENVLIALSTAPPLQNVDAAGCQAYLVHVGKRMPQFSGIVVINANGIIICRQEDKGVGAYLGDRPYFKEAMSTGRFVVGGYLMGRIAKQPLLPLALPLKNDDGKTIGVIVGGLSLKWLGQRLRERDFVQNSALTIAGRDGIIIAREPDPEKFVGTKIPESFQKFVRMDRPGTTEVISRDGTRRVYGFFPPAVSGTGLHISASISTEEAYASILSATWVGLIVTILSLSLSFVLAWLTSRELIQRPVEKLVRTISAWRSDDESARTGMSESSGEIGIVGRAIDDLLAELVFSRQVTALAEQQRELLTNELDHRVKNLLATVQSVARQTFKDNTNPDEAVNVFNQRLAAVSDAHALLMKENWQSAGMLDVVAGAAKPFDNHEHPQFEITGPDFLVKAKAVLSLSMALHEMCTNAVKYGALKTGEGRVSIRWDIESKDGERILHLVWTERDGPPIVPPARFGFGSKMIERVLAYELEAEVETRYPSTGMILTIRAPLSRIRAEQEVYAA
jgi:two-component sensor histidine kinase